MNTKLLQQWLFNPTIDKVVIAIVGVLVIQAISTFVRRYVVVRVHDVNARYRTRKVIAFIGYTIMIFYVTLVFNERLGNLTVAFGVAGAGIAFALQEVITSVAGWFAITFAGFYNVGDRVQLGGIKGDVIDIGVLRTTLMEVGEWVDADLYSGRIVRIANSSVFKAPVFNYSGDFPFLWDEIYIPIKYNSDQRLAREILQTAVTEVVGEYTKSAETTWRQMLRKYMIEPASVEPMITAVANSNWVQYTVRYVVDYKARRSTKDELFMRILEEIDKTEGQVGIASTTFQLIEPPPFDVHLAGGNSQPGHEPSLSRVFGIFRDR